MVQPIHSPLYKLPPYHYSDVEMFQVLYALSFEKIKNILPPELEPANRNRASITFAKYPSVSGLSPYYECFILILALYKNKPVTYCPYVWVNTDDALCAGREIWGFPKKLAEIKITNTSEKITGLVTRQGQKIIDASLCINERGRLQYLMFEDIVVEKITLNAEDANLGRQLIRIRLQNYSLSELKSGIAEVTVNGSNYDFIDDLIPEKIICGNYGRGQMTLPYGRILQG